MPDALFIALAPDRFEPTVHATGPWSAEALHGGAPAALLAGLVERIESPVPMQVTRLTIDLLRPVPVRPLELRTDIVRNGKRVQLVSASLFDGDTEVVRASALRQRIADLALPESAEIPRTSVVGPDQGTPADPDTTRSQAFINGLDVRFVRGGFYVQGPATAWFRLNRAVIDGQPITPLERVAAAGDFGNGLSSVVDWAEWSFVNPDLTIHVHRMPIGDWVGLDSASFVHSSGVGMAESVLLDEHGPIGRAIQSLHVDRTAG